MKIHSILIVGQCLLVTSLSAQTKKIAFESHSGDPSHFQLALTNDFFDDWESDFGLPPSNDVKTYKLDSVIYLSDSVSVVVKKEYSRLITEPKSSAKFVRAVKDTVYNDQLFGRKHALDSIRKVLKNDTNCINSKTLNKVVFIGYDNRKPNQPDRNSGLFILRTGKPGNNSPFDGELVLMLGSLLILSLLGGWLSWKFYQPRVAMNN